MKKNWLTLVADSHRSRPKAGLSPYGVSRTYIRAAESRTYESSFHTILYSISR